MFTTPSSESLGRRLLLIAGSAVRRGASRVTIAVPRNRQHQSQSDSVNLLYGVGAGYTAAGALHRQDADLRLRLLRKDGRSKIPRPPLGLHHEARPPASQRRAVVARNSSHSINASRPIREVAAKPYKCGGHEVADPRSAPPSCSRTRARRRAAGLPDIRLVMSRRNGRAPADDEQGCLRLGPL